MKAIAMVLVSYLSWTTIFSQKNILDDPEIQQLVENCLFSTYGYDFSTAHELQGLLDSRMPQHPAPKFLAALIIYWENFPLLPDDPETVEFIALMDQSVDLAQEMLSKNPESLEGIFFDLHSRAFKAMFWADNGKIAKVLTDLDNMYRQTLEGIRLKEKFDEFYFCSGMYNYYIEAYVEQHPGYKPIIALFRSGDKELGLKELEFAADHTTYIRYESILFLSLLYLNYEHETDRALDHAAELYNNFPENIYYTGQYLIILLYNSNFTIADLLVERINFDESEFHRMICLMTRAFIYENRDKDYNTALEFYKRTISSADSFGEIAELYSAIAHAGIARIADQKNNPREARKYRRQSRQLSGYDFILEYDPVDAR